MDVSEVKARVLGQGGSQAGQAQEALQALGGLPVNFADLMQIATGRADAPLQTITDRGGIGTVEGRSERPEQRPADDRDSSAETSARDDAPRARDDDAPKQADDAKPERADDAPRDDHHDATRDDNGSERQTRDDNHGDQGETRADAKSDKGETSNQGQQAEKQAGDDGLAETNQNLGETTGPNPKAAANAAAQAQAQGLDHVDTPEQALSGLAAAQAAQAAQAQNQADTDGDVQTETQSGRNPALAAAQAAAAGQAQKKDNKGADQQNAQNQAGAQADARAAAAAAQQAADAKRADTPKVQTTAAQQAADMSRLVGEGQKVEVQVDLAKEVVVDPKATKNPATQAPAQDAQASLRAQQAPNAAQAALAGQQAQNQNQQAGQQAAQGGAGGPAQVSGLEARGPQQAALQTANTTAQPTTATASAESAAQANTNTAGNTHTNAANDAKAAAQPRAQVPGQNVADQVNVQITKALADGQDRISIQLKPAELGRVEVQIEMAKDGKLTAVITADNKDTLDLLKADAKMLEKALQDAGLQADSGSLAFNLREQGSGSAQANAQGGRVDPNANLVSEDPVQAALDEANDNFIGIRPDGRVNFLA
ncbi:MAG: flagellar hook-length control protein FliK [Rhodospirillales bacterium]